MEAYELEQVRGLLGHARIETTIRAATPKQAVEFYEAKVLAVLSSQRGGTMSFVFELGRRRNSNTRLSNINGIEVVAPRGFDQVTSYLELDFEGIGLAA